MAEQLIDGIDRKEAERIAASLDELQMKLHGGPFNDYRLAILCGAAALRFIGGVNPSAQGHEWAALAAAENALNSIDAQIDLSKYWCAPDNTLLDLTKEALRLCKKARAAAGVPPSDGGDQ